MGYIQCLPGCYTACQHGEPFEWRLRYDGQVWCCRSFLPDVQIPDAYEKIPFQKGISYLLCRFAACFRFWGANVAFSNPALFYIPAEICRSGKILQAAGRGGTSRFERTCGNA